MIQIDVPGRFRSGEVLLDLETVKTGVPGDFRMANGEILRNRWTVALAGVARDGVISIVEGGNEAMRLAEMGVLLRGSRRVVYGATRQFDEMICRGRFTNARRAHLSAPTFPAVPGAERLSWVNNGTSKADSYRGEDVASRDVPLALKRGDRAVVLVHLLRDVADLILVAGEPSRTCRDWCERVLADYAFALRMLGL